MKSLCSRYVAKLSDSQIAQNKFLIISGLGHWPLCSCDNKPRRRPSVSLETFPLLFLSNMLQLKLLFNITKAIAFFCLFVCFYTWLETVTNKWMRSSYSECLILCPTKSCVKHWHHLHLQQHLHFLSLASTGPTRCVTRLHISRPRRAVTARVALETWEGCTSSVSFRKSLWALRRCLSVSSFHFDLIQLLVCLPMFD